jgi:cell division septum initiation protein DivIVA
MDKSYEDLLKENDDLKKENGDLKKMIEELKFVVEKLNKELRKYVNENTPSSAVSFFNKIRSLKILELSSTLLLLPKYAQTPVM